MINLAYEFLSSFVFDLLVQLVSVLAWQYVIAPLHSRESMPPILVLLSYIGWGLIFGYLTLMVIPNPFLHTMTIKLINIALMPLVVGFAMAKLGDYNRRKNQTPGQIEGFSDALLFSGSMGLVRFFFK